MNSKKNALILTIAILILLISSAIAIYIMNTMDDGKIYAYIYQDNSLIRTIDLSAADEPYSFTVQTENGGYNVIQVENGSIGIIDASCPDSLCKNMGFISSSPMPITCLPNHLVIQLSNELEGEIDGISY